MWLNQILQIIAVLITGNKYLKYLPYLFLSEICFNSETDQINRMIDLGEEQIIDLLEENLDSNATDKDYEKTEDILTDIQSFQSLGDSSIFTGKIDLFWS